ncbi:MAG: MBL fold metallo-hydrolase [Clostridium sp.]|nr:MBL fold metallo-hydrolase [Clostridium sp.]
MNEEILFMPLGGGQRVGASCYYLRLGNANIILDAGIGIENGVVFEPDIYSLLTSSFLESLNQLNQVFISHAHIDHVGFLLKLMKGIRNPEVYMTEMTSLLTKYQLYDKDYMLGSIKTEEERLIAQRILDGVINVSYMQSLDFINYTVTFLPAGHIPGAMMMLFEYGKRKILYTGDYSVDKTFLTDGYFIPDNIKIDTIIMCGLHAKHPNYIKKSNSLYSAIKRIYSEVTRGFSVMCYVPQLSKGIEFIKTLNEYNFQNVPIYIDKSIMPIVEKFEKLSIPILNENNHVVYGKSINIPHIYVTSENKCSASKLYKCIKVDFSLHDDFQDMKRFIKKINPKQVYIVHCPKERSCDEYTIEQTVMLDGECRTQFVFAEEGEIYKL